MAPPKLYAGARLREIRTRAGLTQAAFAARLGVSLPYLNQMENNNRPVSTAVLIGLAQEFGVDIAALQTGDEARLVSDMREALADPVFDGDTPSLDDLRLAAGNAPALARAFLDLHRAYRQSIDRLATLDEALGETRAGPPVTPWEEVRDFFHYCDNYVDAIDRAAERFAAPGTEAAIAGALERLGVRVARAETDRMRSFDPETRVLTLSTRLDAPTRSFQTLVQIALLDQAELIGATLDLARFRTEAARDIARLGLANYFAGAALLPYGRFAETAEAMRHDLARLALAFGASLEQVAHRLSTLQRPGAKGLPFFFVRVDQAGTITKRHSATSLQFARFGGACPLWNVHQAFETPGRFLRQLAETPDGERYICLAVDVSKPGHAWGAPARRFAIGLGCEIRHADRLVYSDGLDLTDAGAFEPIGISCRICPREGCHQRSVPPVDRPLAVTFDARGALPYRIG